MLTTIEGVYRGGKIELSETPREAQEGTSVLVTFLASDSVNLRSRGIDEARAADLRTRLATFTEDWESPEMSIYDNYDAAKSKLPPRYGC